VVADGLSGGARGSPFDVCLRKAARKLVFGPSIAGAAVSVVVARE